MTDLATVAGCADPMVPQPFDVRRVRQETHDTFTMELRSRDGPDGIRFAPGQFNMLSLCGVGEVPISISGDPFKQGSFVHTTRAVGAVTRAMGKLKRGNVLGVRGPYGTGWPMEQAAGCDVVVVGGGIGLAPLRSAIYGLLAQREKFGKVIILYGSRTPADILYRDELEQWRGRFDLDVHVTVDRAMAGWRGSVGVVTTLIHKASFDPLDTVAMICGPELMMRFTVMEFQKREIPDSRIFVSMERNMKCGIGLCGHCQYGPVFICREGPVFSFDRIKPLFNRREL